MSTYAKDLRKGVISAFEAKRSEDYFCLECGSIVRLRMGNERQAHFYHFEPSSDCREAGKSLEHLMTQIHIQKLFENRPLVLEKRFPKINRIADACLTDDKIVFEIQVSPMKAQEALDRIYDYNSIGYEVVWILHTKTFLQPKASAFEHALNFRPHYFTDMNAQGLGTIFDTFAPIQQGYRRHVSDRFPIMLEKFHKNVKRHPFRKTWPLFFSGDLLSHIEQKTINFDVYRQIVAASSEIGPKLNLWERFCLTIKIYFNELLHQA